MKDKKIFGSFLKEKRIEKNFSQKDLAELLYVTESAVSKWERGVTYPDITLIQDICKVLDITEHELIESSNDVEYRKIKKDAKKFNKLKRSLFWSFNILYAIAIITCFIVNLAVDLKLSWFFIVLASIIVAYSFCPTFTVFYHTRKDIIFIISTFISLFILFLTCSIYSNNYWFMIPTVSILLGYFIILYPIYFYKQKEFMNEENYNKFKKLFLLTYSFGILIILLLLLVIIYFYRTYNLALGVIIVIGLSAVPIIFGILIYIFDNKLIIKLCLLILVIGVIIITAISVGSTLYLQKTEKDVTYEINNTYNNVLIDIKHCDLYLYKSENLDNKIVCTENDKITFNITNENGVLSIILIDNRNFYQKLFNFKSLKVELFLTNEMIKLLDVNNDTGDIEVNSGFKIEDFRIKNSTGNINLFSNDINKLNIETSTGDVKLENGEIKEEFNIVCDTGDISIINIKCVKLDIKISTGNTKLHNTIVNNDLFIESSTGNIQFDSFDAKNIYISTSTGDVKGTILTDKIFNCHSSTGNVYHPSTYTGGICEIITSTGNIDIKYK